MKDMSRLFSVTHPQLASKLLFIYSPTFSTLNPQYLENMKRKAFNPSSLSQLDLKSEKMIYFSWNGRFGKKIHRYIYIFLRSISLFFRLFKFRSLLLVCKSIYYFRFCLVLDAILENEIMSKFC